MSDPINNFQGPNGWDTASSQNAGRSQAQQGGPSSPQQANESWHAFVNRQNAYDSNKRD